MSEVSAPLLSLKQASAGYGEKIVVHDAAFDVFAGEIFGLIGLNGEGKTTLIKSILGLRPQISGNIHICGGDSARPNVRQDAVYLPERFSPPWFLSGAEFLKFSQSLYAMPYEHDEAEVYAQKLALDVGVLRNKVQTYSKGMRQKLGLISALMAKRSLMILDEPMSGLDPLARVRVKEALVEARKDGQAILICSHILVDMDEICDRIAVLHGGALRFVGAPQSLKDGSSTQDLEHAFLKTIDKN